MATFHLFPRLPYELRMQIWEMTVEARTIEIRVKNHEWRTTNQDLVETFSVRPRPPVYLVSSTPVPAVLHVCWEARNHGLYQKAFSEVSNWYGVGVQYLWLNWEIDIIDIGSDYLEHFKPIAHLFRRLMFEINFLSDCFLYDLAHKLFEFKNVKETYVVCAEPSDLIDWLDHFDDWYYWFCGKENTFFIDKTSGQVFRGEAGLDEIERLYGISF